MRPSHSPCSGFIRLTLDLPLQNHLKFKSLCALNRTTMSHEVNAMIAAALADPDRLLTDVLYVRVSPELKRELVELATRREISLGTLLLETVMVLERERAARVTASNGHHRPSRPAAEVVTVSRGER
jgi:hypothetical protein